MNSVSVYQKNQIGFVLHGKIAHEHRVQTTVTRYPGIYHGFLMRSEATARGRLAMAEIGGLLRAKFANPLPFGTR